MNNLEKRLIGNTFKGFIVNNDGVYLKSYIEETVKEYLLTIHESQKETIEITEGEREYAKRILNKAKREKNFKLLPAFQRSSYVDHNNWEGSYTNYLKMLQACYLSYSSETELFKKINDKLDSLIDPEEKEQLREDSKKFLDVCLTFVSNFGMTFDIIASESNYKLEALSFIDTINEYSSEFAKGTSFWFNKLGNLITMSIYQIKLNKQNNILFNENINKILSSEFIRVFNDILGDPSRNYNNEEYESYVKSFYNKSVISYDKLNIKPLFYFGTQNKREVFNQGNQLTTKQKDNLVNLSLACEVVEEYLYNKRISPKLTLISFKQDRNDYLLIQKSSQDASLGVLYKVFPGKQMFSEILSIHEELFNKNLLLFDTYLSEDITKDKEEFLEEFISEIQDCFILKDLKNK